LGQQKGSSEKDHKKKKALGIAMTFVFNFPLVPNTIQLFKEKKKRKEKQGREVPYTRIVQFQKLKTASCCPILWALNSSCNLA
jgi:predicted RND superfamily exporter protein